MKLTRTPSLLPGERPVAVHPAFAPAIDARWQRRLNLYAGRTLTAGALDAEQAHRAARMALMAQGLSRGVVSGLECAVETEITQRDGVEQTIHYVRIEPGLGITADGEEIALDKGQRIDVMNVPVYAPVAILGPDDDGGVAGPEAGAGALSARRLGPALRELIAPERGLPRAGILVLEAVSTELIGEFDPTDPCERDPRNEAFEDQLKADAVRLVYYAWPTEWRPLPATDGQWRNRLAYAIFDAERALGREDALPWEELGLPVALVGFDPDWQPLFTDRAAVVRAGGKPHRRDGIVSGAGTPFLWQARVEQVAEHATDYVNSQLALPKPEGLSDEQWRAGIAAALPAQFRYLPPFGLLPKEIAAPRARSQTFFPASFTVDAVPIPVEQLDAAMEQSAALASFDTFTTDSVRVLVPVPHNWYEPRLLQIEEVNAEFTTTLDEFIARRGMWLQRREDVRAKASALNRAITGKPLEFALPDPDALEEETPGTAALDPPEEAYGTVSDAAGIKVSELETLKNQLRSATPISGVTREAHATALSFPATLDPELRAKISYDATARQIAFDGVMTPVQRDQLLTVSSDAGYRATIGRLFTRSLSDELGQLEARGVEGFIALLEEKIARSDDLVDFGFLRVQTDLFRIRQLVLGTTAASRLAVSPALAGFAKTKSAAASQQQLSKFYQNLKGRGITPPPGEPVPSVPAATPPSARASIRPAQASRAALSTGASALNLASDFQLTQPVLGAGAVLGGQSAFERLAGKTTTADLVSRQGAAALLEPVKIAATQTDIVGQSAVVGKALLRSSTIAERMEAPQAPEAKNSATATKHDVVKSLAELPISVDGLSVPGIATGEIDQKSGLPVRGAARPLGDFARAEALRDLLNEPDPRTDDESLFFVSGVELADHTIATLRNVEGRIQQYRAALELCRAALARLKPQSASATLRLQAIGRELAEARHDVGVGRALLAEETARVARINERREQIVREHVAFVAYQRPRASDTLLAAPVRPLAAGLYESPVPACVQSHGDGPHELRALIEVLREAPVGWFTGLRPNLTRLDRHEVLVEVAQHAKLRATRYAATATNAFPARGGPLANAVTTIVSAQQNLVAARRLSVAQLDLGALAGVGWQAARDRISDSVSLGDLMDHPGRRADLARDVSAEVQRITGVAACMHARFAQVAPIVRLGWVERLSQYDGPLNLRNLSALPRFDELEVLDRRDLQELADWLHGRVDPRQTEAVGLVNDVIRLTILLASHAPVNEIVSGRVRVPATVRPGHRIELTAFDMTKVRIGMQVMMYDRSQVVARAVVEDLGANQVAARVLEAAASGVALGAETRVHYTEARSLGIASGAARTGAPR